LEAAPAEAEAEAAAPPADADELEAPADREPELEALADLEAEPDALEERDAAAEELERLAEDVARETDEAADLEVTEAPDAAEPPPVPVRVGATYAPDRLSLEQKV
jgi:hypothetical protein